MKRQRLVLKVAARFAAIALAALLGPAFAHRHTVLLDPGTGTGMVTGGTDRQDAQLQQIVLCAAPAASTAHDGALVVVSGNLWELAATRDLTSGWTATHDGFALDEVIAAYTAWFCGAGVQISAATGSASVWQFDVSGAALGTDARVVFADVGTGVRVYIGRF